MPLHGIGIAVGGMVDTEAGQIIRMDFAPVLNGLPIARIVEPDSRVTTYVDLQPRAQALGDLLFGAGRGERSYASVYIGQGIGAGFHLRRRTASRIQRRGRRGRARHRRPQWSTLPVQMRGCWEALANRRWVQRAAAEAEAFPAPGDLSISQRWWPTRHAIRAPPPYSAEYTENVALGIANLQRSTSDAASSSSTEIRQARASRVPGRRRSRRARNTAFAHPGGPVRVVLGTTDDVAALRGAAALVLSQALHIAF